LDTKAAALVKLGKSDEAMKIYDKEIGINPQDLILGTMKKRYLNRLNEFDARCPVQ
jgi:hypothetical protein